MSANRQRILLIVDGSDQASEAVNYAGRLLAPLNTEIVLFQVLDQVPESFWDWERDPLIPQHIEYMKGWEVQREQKARDFLEHSRHTLIEAGFPSDHVTIKLHKREEGIARDILIESGNGYTALIMGRKGASSIDDQMLGTTASKVIGSLGHLPVCLVGGKPKAGKILVGLDRSEGARRAVEQAAVLAQGNVETVCLLHVVRTPMKDFEQIIPAQEVRRFMDSAGASIQPTFENARAILSQRGFSPSKVMTKVVAGVSSRANAIMKEAQHSMFGTIIVGRRGMSELEAFEMGRVANKLIQFAKDAALWIVN
jgi:nucleotide-binding universal stress UspA family protein